MMELPDGYVLLFDPDRLGLKINVTEIELVRCKHCKHCFRVKIWETSYLECEQYTPKMVDETDWCCWAEKRDSDEENTL